MLPPSESTKLEAERRFVEYIGSGKLTDKKVLITGGEYVLKPRRQPFVDGYTVPELVARWPF